MLYHNSPTTLKKQANLYCENFDRKTMENFQPKEATYIATSYTHLRCVCHLNFHVANASTSLYFAPIIDKFVQNPVKVEQQLLFTPVKDLSYIMAII